MPPKRFQTKPDRRSAQATLAGAAPPRRHPVRLVVADNHILLRELIVTLLKSKPSAFQVVAAVDSTDDAISACDELDAEILLIDLGLMSAAGGSVIARLRRRNPSVRILLYSGSASDEEIVKAMQRGIDGFIGKGSSSAEFLAAVDLVSQGENYFCPQSSRLLAEIACGKHVEVDRDCCLSPRETEILRLIASGQTSKEIAAALGLSVATVDTHRRNAMAKIGARNAADLIRYGHKHGLLNFVAGR